MYSQFTRRRQTLHTDMYHQYTIEEIRREIHTERICENGTVLPPVIAVRFEDYLINDNTLEVSYAEEAESIDNLATDRNASENRIIECSVLSEKIVAYDKETVLSEAFDPMQEENSAYRPFFASFMIKADRETQARISKLEYAWYGAYFYPLEKADDHTDLFSAESYITTDAVFQFSASPGFSLEGKLVIVPEKKDIIYGGVHINKSYDTLYDADRFEGDPDEKVREELQGLWKKDALRTVEIYNVGQGNANYLRCGKNRVLFDIGYPIKSVPAKNPLYYRRALLAIRQAKPSVVVLSNWDFDHYAGWVYANTEIFNVPWIAPTLYHRGYKKRNRTATSIGTNAYRLASYLKKKQLLMLLDWKDVPRTVASLGGQGKQVIGLEMGGFGSGDWDIALRNRHGLYFTIADENGHANTVLAADVPYSSMRDGIIGDALQILHVPHHCSKMKLDAIEKPGLSALKTAILSAERGMEYDLHRIKLEKCFGSSNMIFTTDQYKDNETLAVEIQFNAMGPVKTGTR